MTTYIDDKGHRVSVMASGCSALAQFVAVVEDSKGQRRVVPGLEWRDWFSDAQTDLDALAEKRADGPGDEVAVPVHRLQDAESLVHAITSRIRAVTPRLTFSWLYDRLPAAALTQTRGVRSDYRHGMTSTFEGPPSVRLTRI